MGRGRIRERNFDRTSHESGVPGTVARELRERLPGEKRTEEKAARDGSENPAARDASELVSGKSRQLRTAPEGVLSQNLGPSRTPQFFELTQVSTLDAWAGKMVERAATGVAQVGVFNGTLLLAKPRDTADSLRDAFHRSVQNENYEALPIERIVEDLVAKAQRSGEPQSTRFNGQIEVVARPGDTVGDVVQAWQTWAQGTRYRGPRIHGAIEISETMAHTHSPRGSYGAYVEALSRQSERLERPVLGQFDKTLFVVRPGERVSPSRILDAQTVESGFSGQPVRELLSTLVHRANDTGTPQSAQLNGRGVVVKPGDTVEQLVEARRMVDAHGGRQFAEYVGATANTDRIIQMRDPDSGSDLPTYGRELSRIAGEQGRAVAGKMDGREVVVRPGETLDFEALLSAPRRAGPPFGRSAEEIIDGILLEANESGAPVLYHFNHNRTIVAKPGDSARDLVEAWNLRSKSENYQEFQREPVPPGPTEGAGRDLATVLKALDGKNFQEEFLRAQDTLTNREEVEQYVSNVYQRGSEAQAHLSAHVMGHQAPWYMVPVWTRAYAKAMVESAGTTRGNETSPVEVHLRAPSDVHLGQVLVEAANLSGRPHASVWGNQLVVASPGQRTDMFGQFWTAQAAPGLRGESILEITTELVRRADASGQVQKAKVEDLYILAQPGQNPGHIAAAWSLMRGKGEEPF